MNEAAQALLVLAIIGGAVWLVFGQAIHAPFLLDDANCIEHNPSIRQLWPLVGNAEVPGPLNVPPELSTSGRPLVNLSLALNYQLGGLDPTGYHLFNILVHVGTAGLLWLIVNRALRLACFDARFGNFAGVLAFLVALVWAIHPLQTETVEYVTQRTELMVGFFYLATVYASLRYWSAATQAARWRWLSVAALACLLGAACKEVIVSAPVVVLLFERTFIAGSWRKAIRDSWPLYLGFAASWGLLLILNISGPRSSTAGFHLGLPAHAWWFTQAKVLLMYLKLAIWPWPQVIHYEFAYEDTLRTTWPWVISAALLIVLTVVLNWRRTATGFALACVFVLLSPTLVVPILTEVAAERRMYLPLAALTTLAVVGSFELARRLESD